MFQVLYTTSLIASVLQQILFFWLCQNTAIKEKDRSVREIEKLKNLMADLEGKQSALKEELVDVKEKLNRASLSKEVLEQEKAHLSELQAKSESQKEELEIERKMIFQILVLPIHLQLLFFP